MLGKIEDMKKDELVRGSFILFMMIVLYNFFNYIFQITMAKFLGPSDYSVLAVLMSIVYVFGIPSEAIQTIITKHVSILSIKKEDGKIKDLLLRSLRKGFLVSLVFFVFFIIMSFFLSSFLNINSYLIILTGSFIFLIFLLPAIRGFIQGTKKFFTLGSNLIVESVSKLIISLGLVFLGMQVYGAVIGVLLGSLFALIITVYPLRDILKAKREKFDATNLYVASLPIIIATLSIVLMYSIDIILARRFFPSEIAGQYSFVSLIGKVIIFVSSAIGKAMFPISTGEYNSGVKDTSLLKKSLVIVMIMSIFSLILYLSIPELIVKVISLGSTEYLEASHLLFNLGLAYSFISLGYIIILYKLSQNKVNKSAYFLLVFIIVEIVLLYNFHDNLYEYSLATLSSSLLIFLYSLFLIKK